MQQHLRTSKYVLGLSKETLILHESVSLSEPTRSGVDVAESLIAIDVSFPRCRLPCQEPYLNMMKYP